MNTINNGELTDPPCDSVNRGLTLVRLISEWYFKQLTIIHANNQTSQLSELAVENLPHLYFHYVQRN